MTTNELLDRFSILLDEFGGDEFDNDRMLAFLNHAQDERLKRLIPDDQNPVLNYEFDQNTLANVRPLIYPISTTMSSTGVITFAAIQTALRTASGDNGCGVHRLVNVAWTTSNESRPVKFTKHNNWYAYKRNYFKVGSSTEPRYMVDATNMTIDPVDQTASITITCMKTPKIMEAGNTPDWDNANLGLILEIALQLAAQSMTDGELLSSVHNSKVSN